jgi:hypothetical protein
VLVGDWPLPLGLVGKGLTAVPVLHALVPVVKVLLLADKGLHVLLLVGGKMLLLVGSGLRLQILVLGLLLVCGSLKVLMPVLVGGKLPVLVLVGGKCVVYYMRVVAVLSFEGVRLSTVKIILLLGRSRA